MNLNQSTNSNLMNKFFGENRLILTPQENDRFILEYARDNDAAIISNNDFRDYVYGI